MRVNKYYGTNISLSWDASLKIKEKGYSGSHNQFRVVCKAKSMAEANRISEDLGIGRKTFHRDWTSETGNETEIKMCDKYGFIICIDGTLGDNFIDIKEIL